MKDIRLDSPLKGQLVELKEVKDVYDTVKVP